MKKFIEEYKNFERMIIDEYNPRSVVTSPQVGVVKLFELYLKNKHNKNDENR